MRVRWRYLLALAIVVVGVGGHWGLPRAESAWERHRDAVDSAHNARDLPLVLADARRIQPPVGTSPRRCGPSPDFAHAVACWRYSGTPSELLPALVTALREAGLSHVRTVCSTLPGPGSLRLRMCGAQARDRSYMVGLSAGTRMVIDRKQHPFRPYAQGADVALAVAPA